MTWEQTADVLAKEAARLQKENDRLREFVHEVAHVNAADFADGWKALVEFAKRGRELLSPTAEGGGAANGGESQALQDKLVEENQIIREAIIDSDRVHIKIEKKLNKAIQSAIMGLHTLAGEFPTPTWKTREDYLQATISEINEILGKQ